MEIPRYVFSVRSNSLLCLFNALLCMQAKAGMPTRHVVMKTGGGLTYASTKYYNVFSSMEDRFFCTVTMRQSFAVESDIIKRVEDNLLSDMGMRADFLAIMPPTLHSIGEELYPMFVHRMATLHGTELARQLMEELASSKRMESKVRTHIAKKPMHNAI